MTPKNALEILTALIVSSVAVFANVLWSAQRASAAGGDHWAGIPDAVRATFDAQRPDETPSEIEHEMEDGREVYEAEYRSDKGNADITVAADGTLLFVKTKVRSKDLPQAVTNSLNAAYPGATIKEAESVSLGYYEFDLRVDGKKVEVVMQRDGTMRLNSEEDDEDEAGDDNDGEEN